MAFKKVGYLECYNFNIIFDFEEVLSKCDMVKKLQNVDQYGFDYGEPFYLKSKRKNLSLINYDWSFRLFVSYANESKLISNYELNLPLRALNLFCFEEIIKAFSIINYFRPKFQWEFIKKPEYFLTRPRDTDIINGNVIFKFVENDQEFTFEDYINYKFKTLSHKEYNEIILEALADIDHRDFLREEKRQLEKEWRRDQPSLRDAFDDYDQYSSWDISR